LEPEQYLDLETVDSDLNWPSLAEALLEMKFEAQKLERQGRSSSDLSQSRINVGGNRT
jgi:hypothetical protein